MTVCFACQTPVGTEFRSVRGEAVCAEYPDCLADD